MNAEDIEVFVKATIPYYELEKALRIEVGSFSLAAIYEAFIFQDKTSSENDLFLVQNKLGDFELLSKYNEKFIFHSTCLFAESGIEFPTKIFFWFDTFGKLFSIQIVPGMSLFPIVILF
jgi:hypothetical protein